MKVKRLIPILIFLVSIFLIGCEMPAEGNAIVNINTASVKELMTLKGIADFKAQAIIDYRTANGPFKTIEDIQKVKGIGKVTFDDIKERIVVEDPIPAEQEMPAEPIQ